ncbi:MAG: HAMP domain-containing sensor histidine kinase [Flavobacteriaceae bacterium]|nr:HAMP domain-containing sensor histidine kinase [Flavobacteriaceae bacterium]
MKFKSRIAFFNMIAVAVTSSLVFVAIYFVLRETAYSHLDNDIVLEKNEILGNIDWHKDSLIIRKLPEWNENEHNKVEVNPTFLQIVDATGKIVFHSDNLLEDQFLFNPANTQETYYNSEISGQKIRLGQFAIKNEAHKIIGQLTIAISRQESAAIFNSLIIVLLISFPLMLIGQYAASTFAATKAIKPVHQLIKTTSGIGNSNLSTRLVLPERKDELYLLTNTINELLARIEKSMLQQKQFTGDASHEIRTPLAAIRGTLEVLIRKQREPIVYEEKISTIINQVDRLDVLLDQLLQLTRIESGASFAKKEAVNLESFINSLCEKWCAIITDKGIKLHSQITKDAEVIVDRFFLELMLDNLVVNAVKYGKNNGNIFVIWNPDFHTLDIKDDGIGIASEHLPNIFNSFYRTDESRSSTIKGNGLGLSIVKKLSEIQNITLTVKSEVGVGSTFTLQFPT